MGLRVGAGGREMSQPIQRGAGPDPPRLDGGWKEDGRVCAGGMARRYLVGLSRGAGQGPPHRWAEGWKLGGRWGGKVWASWENLFRGAGKVPPKREAMKTSKARGACSGTLYNCCCRVIPGY